MYSQQDCLTALNKAAEELGRSPSKKEYAEMDILPSTYVIQDRFESWNKAKELAGLEELEGGVDIDTDIPRLITLSEDEWRDISPQRRTHLRKAARWAEVKLDKGCERCGYNEHPSALEWHHLRDKESAVSHLIRSNRSDEIIQEEVDKCIVLCSNCHAVEESVVLSGGE